MSNYTIEELILYYKFLSIVCPFGKYENYKRALLALPGCDTLTPRISLQYYLRVYLPSTQLDLYWDVTPQQDWECTAFLSLVDKHPFGFGSFAVRMTGERRLATMDKVCLVIIQRLHQPNILLEHVKMSVERTRLFSEKSIRERYMTHSFKI